MAPTETGTTRPEMQQVTKKKPRRGGGGSGGGRDRRTTTNDKNKNGKKFDKKFRNKHDKHNDKQNNKHSSKNFITTTGRRPRHDRLDISFDQVERKQYLTTLSSKKKDRRVFGLAMQKLKDRRARLDMRKEEREAQLEQVEEAERTKGRALVGFNGGECESSDDDDDDDNDNEDNEDNEDGDSDGGEEMTEPLAISGSTNTIAGDKANLNTTTFQDEQTQSQFGGQVIVTTTFGGLSDDDDDDDDNRQKNNGVDRPNAKHADVDQQYAGSVKKYMAQLKRNQPSKKHKRSQGGGGTMAMGGKKGQHGAEGMKGMGNAKQLKMAQKILRGKQKRSGGGGAADGMIGKGKKKQRKK